MSPGLLVRGRQVARVGTAVKVSRSENKRGEGIVTVVPPLLRVLLVPRRISEPGLMLFLSYRTMFLTPFQKPFVMRHPCWQFSGVTYLYWTINSCFDPNNNILKFIYFKYQQTYIQLNNPDFINNTEGQVDLKQHTYKLLNSIDQRKKSNKV